MRPGLLHAQEPPQAPRVDSVEVVGNTRVTTQTILNTAGIPIRSPISIRDIQRAMRALFGLGQFNDVTIARRSGDAGEEILIITVAERPVLASWVVRGADKVSEGQVRDRVTLTSGRPLDPAALALSQLAIDSMYEAQGYYLAKVENEIQPLDSNQVRVIFDIEEGRRVAIAQVRIDGNVSFRDEDIVKQMRSRPEGFFWFQQGEYSDVSLREDVEQRIPDFYGEFGYVDFRIVRDTLEVEPGSGKATLVIEVDEGRPYRVGSVTVEGNRYFSAEQILTLNPFVARQRSGVTCLFRRCNDSTIAWFDRSAWDEATTRLKTNYANEGYIYADVQAVVEPAPQDSLSGEIPVVNLVWRINESRPAIINRIEIVGNDVTHERIIREAIVVLPGDVFAQDRIIRSYQNISNLNFFQQPMPFPDTRPANEEGDIDLIFRVEEKHTGSVNFGASVGQGTGVGGFLGLEEPNLFGEGKRGRLQWQFGRNINDFNLSYSDPQLFGSRVSGTIELNNSRVRYTVADLGRIYNRGMSLQFGFPLPRSRYSRLFVTGAVDWERYTGTASQLSGLQCRNCFRTVFGASLLRDTRIDLPFPTGGSYHQVATNFNGPFGTGTATFQKFDLEGRWYTQVGRLGGTQTVGGVKLVLGLTAKAGFVTGNPGPFFRQLYSMGGTQFGIPLRGYEEFAITPAGFNPNAGGSGVDRSAFGRSYFATTAEFGVRLSQMIYVSSFYDAGNVWATAGGFNPTRLFRGAGFGVSLITPLGPIGLDLAYGFDALNRAGEPAPGWKLHFRIGNFF